MRTIMFLFVLTACNQSLNEEYYGYWFRCDHSGQYSEIHIDKNELIFNFNVPNGWYNPHTYEIINDTLVYLDTLHNWLDNQGHKMVIKNQTISNNSLITFLSGTFDSVTYVWTFQRFPHKIIEYQENDSISESMFMDREFYKRSELVECQDLRTEEEKKLDSIGLNKISEDIL